MFCCVLPVSPSLASGSVGRSFVSYSRPGMLHRDTSTFSAPYNCHLCLRLQSEFRVRLAHVISPRTALFYLPSYEELWRCAAAPFRMCRLTADSPGEPVGGGSLVSSRSICIGDASSSALRYGVTVDDIVLVLIVVSSILQVRCRSWL